MIRIALIGGTGTGKSTVAAYLRDCYQAVWLDCDAIGHSLLNEPEIQAKLVLRFGNGIMKGSEKVQILDNHKSQRMTDYSDDKKEVNRQRLGEIVFQDREALTDLNAIMHPPIMAELKKRQEASKQAGAPICVLDGALLMDVNVRQMVDEVWAITADRELRIDRLMNGRQVSREKAEQIMKNQISPEEYAAYADRVIATDQGERGFAEEIAKILGKKYTERQRDECFFGKQTGLY